jgi:hypothetical protein
MAKITNKSGLNIGTELTVDTTARTITLNIAGNLVAKDGVAWQALYSKLIALWQTSTYNEHPFPFYTIDALSGQFNIGFDGTRYNTWTFAGSSRLYLRDGGWNEYTATTPGADGTASAGTVNSTYAGVVSLGTVSSGTQLYYQLTNGGTANNFTYTDPANLGVQVFGDASHGNFSSVTYLKGFCREYAKKYTESILSDTGKTGTGAYLVNLLLSNSDDLDIVNTDTDVITTPIAPYSAMSIKYFGSAYAKDVDLSATPRSFGIVVDVGTHSGIDGAGASAATTFTSATGGIVIANYYGGTLTVHNGAAKGTYTIAASGGSATSVPLTTGLLGIASGASFTLQRAVPVSASLKQIYTFVQAKLRQATTINGVTGGTSVIGKTASLLLNWTAKLVCGFYAPTNPAGGGSGVIVEGLADADVNSIQFYDNTAVSREYPYAAAATIEFSSNLVTGGAGYYVLYYADLSSTNDWGTANAVKVTKKTGGFVEGTIAGSSVSFTYDYTNETAGGLRTGSTDTAVVLVAGNPGFAKPVVVATNAAGGLTASKTIKITATAETDRAYV